MMTFLKEHGLLQYLVTEEENEKELKQAEKKKQEIAENLAKPLPPQNSLKILCDNSPLITMSSRNLCN